MAEILIIEDDTQHLEYLAEVIRFGGHSPHPAKTPATALKILEQTHVDIIITDIYLPFMTGLEFVRYLRDKGSRIPVVIVSGSNDPDHMQAAERLKVRSYLTKPLDPEKLIKVLKFKS